MVSYCFDLVRDVVLNFVFEGAKLWLKNNEREVKIKNKSGISGNILNTIVDFLSLQKQWIFYWTSLSMD